jgi:pimeloyl-ACP methyl ester carboxylesterase
MAVVISRDGTRIGFDREGQGPPVVLVDGAMCYRGSGPMKPLAAKLAPHFTVFTYDRRGRGESGDTQPWSLERGGGRHRGLVREAGEPVYLYGISSGAVLALEAGRSRRADSQAGALRGAAHGGRHADRRSATTSCRG